MNELFKQRLTHEVIDEINEACIVELIVPICAVSNCQKHAQVLFSILEDGGRRSVYGLCRAHCDKMKSKFMVRVSQTFYQSAFFYQ